MKNNTRSIRCVFYAAETAKGEAALKVLCTLLCGLWYATPRVAGGTLTFTASEGTVSINCAVPSTQLAEMKDVFFHFCEQVSHTAYLRPLLRGTMPCRILAEGDVTSPAAYLPAYTAAGNIITPSCWG